MLIVLPFIFLTLLFLVLVQRFNLGKRDGFLWSAVVAGVCLVFFVEMLSLFSRLNAIYLSLAWSLAAVILVIILIRHKIRHKKKLLCFEAIKIPAGYVDRIMIVLIIIIVLITVFLALFSPPNNYDAMTYHMSRVAHWMQNHNIEHYPTHIIRQLIMPPMAEFMVLNLQILSGNDYFANFIQWLSMIGSLIIVSLIAKILGADYRGQIFSVFIAATIPMGIMQSCSTQNDYVTAFWLLCFVVFILKYSYEKAFVNILGLSFALGLAILTKGVVYIYAFPFGLWLFFLFVRRKKWGFWKPLLLLLFVVFLINSGHYTRNIKHFNSVIGPPTDVYLNEVFSIKNTSSNILKYSALNLNTPFDAANKIIYKGVSVFHNILNIDINDRRTSAFTEFSVMEYAPHEDLVGNPLHWLIILFSGIFLISKSRDARYHKMLIYFILVFSGFLMFFMVIKYQPWLNRLTLSILILFSPVIGALFDKFLSKKILVTTFVLLLFIGTLPLLLVNVKKPLIPPPFVPEKYKYSILSKPREFFYFAAKPETYECYKKVVNIVKEREYQQIGLIKIENEYPLWILLKNSNINFRLEHMEVENPSKSIQIDFSPSAVIVVDPNPDIDQKYISIFKYHEIIGRDSSGLEVKLYGR
ncbi:MAG: glycosyltransferase family 39 protein [Candidatus Saganbacteria bacterium]|nr:glycosyltransferase family 39 protein [Candidatus Saganbacteria bacterium]